jgi:MinD superfamily P-loop ATPase
LDSSGNSRKEEGHFELILIDEPPRMGCPVIASISGTDSMIIITESTLSAQHDLQNIVVLCKHFDIDN